MYEDIFYLQESHIDTDLNLFNIWEKFKFPQ